MGRQCNDIVCDFNSDDLECRRLAAEKLAESNHLSKAEKTILIEHLDLENECSEDVREWCAYAIGHNRVSEASDALISALNQDKVKDVKIMVERAMGRIGNPSFVPPLSRQLELSSDVNERKHICLALLDGALVSTDKELYKDALMIAIKLRVVPDDVLPRIAKKLPQKKTHHTEEPQQSVLFDDPLQEMPKPKPNDIIEVNISRQETHVVVEYERSQKLKNAILRKRGAICQLCGVLPFKQKNGEDYAEVHHIQLLSKEGEDAEENLLVVCPTCHKKLHYADTKAHYDVVQCKYIDVTINGEIFKINWD